jgi:aldehyde dehydrogenase (NAD+)
LVTEALHEAGLPVGVFNIVTGRGEVVGAEIISQRADLSQTGTCGVMLRSDSHLSSLTAP